MNLQTLHAGFPLWAWLAFAAIAYFVAKRKGWLDKPPTGPQAALPASPAVSRDPAPAAQVVRFEHVAAPSPPAAVDASTANPLTKTRRVEFGFDIDVTPRPSPEAPK